jgi:prolyl-tRNA editing enzyme YbaK/EbsC (Cys-tRNA(Pro) deacylase)
MPPSVETLPRACQAVAEAAARLGLAIEIRLMAQSTRTAEEAAAACGCAVAQIVKSLVFRGKNSGRPILLLVSGANRVDEKKAGARIGEAIERPDAAFVRDKTGFAIGGVPPFGHAEPAAVFIDRDLLAYPVVYAAAGAPNAIFAVEPNALQAACAAAAIEVR